MTRPALLVALTLVSAAATIAAQQTAKPNLSQPSVVAAPAWQLAIQMPDGRTFVSDGGFAIDAKLAKPAVMPTKVLPVANGAIIDGQLKTDFTDEIALSALRPGTFKNTFLGPRDIPLNGNYVTYLRRVAPQSRLRFKGPLDTIVVMNNGQAVGLLMAVAMPK